MTTIDKDRGFTILEFMFVIAILGILLSIAGPKFGDTIKKAQEKQCLSNRTIISSSAKRYMFEKGILNPSITDMRNARYIDRIPKCSANGIYVWLNDATEFDFYREVGCSVHGIPVPVGPEPVVVYTNDFSAAMTGMTTKAGSWSVSGGFLRSGTSSSNRAVINTPVSGNFDIAVVARLVSGVPSNPDFGIFYNSQWSIGHSSPDQGYYFRYNTQNNRFELTEYGGNNGQRNFNFPPGFLEFDATHAISISVVDNNHTIKVDGNTVFNFNDTSFTSGQVGVGASRQAARFDSITVTQN